jgi:putative tributyrin esterase
MNKNKRRSMIVGWILAVVVTFGLMQAQSQPDPPSLSRAAGPTGGLVCFEPCVLKKGEYTFSVEHRTSDETLASKLMAREMPYRVILPSGYARSEQARFPVIYLLHGLFGHYDNWTTLAKLAEHAAKYQIIIITPEGGDGWYTDGISNSNENWESYIVQELIPEIDKKFRTLPIREKRAIAGLSMGGYGSLKFGLKNPDKFVLVGSFSGALRAAEYTEKSYPGAIGKTVEHIYGPTGSPVRKANDLFGLLRSQSAESIKKLPFIYLDCGTEDFLFQDSRDFVSLLIEKKVPHEYRQLPGAHNWKYWDKQVQEFLHVANRSFSGH